MTAPRPAPDTELTERLAAALPESLGPVGLRRRAVPALGYDGEITGYGLLLLEALAPVVQQYAAEKAAEALETAADALHDLGVRQFRADAFDSAELVRARAAALRTATDRSSKP